MVNPRRISLARERRGYAKIALAKRIGVDPRSITAYESAEFTPGPETLRALSLALDFPESFFYCEDIEALPSSGASFRSMTKMTAARRDMALAQGSLATHLSKWLDERFELPEVDLPDLDHELYRPEAAAQAVRTAWGLGHLGIRNMVHLLESRGVRVFSLGIDSREVDAFSVWKGGTPFVFLNGFKSAERSRFDAAHELGHLVMHKHASPNGRPAEREADQFAAAFLMPADSVIAETPRMITLNALIELKSKWIVSVAAFAYRLHELHLLTDWQYRSLCKQMNRRGYLISEPLEAQREQSIILPEIFSFLYREEGLTRSAIAESLAIPPAELEQLLFGLTMAAIPGGRRGATGPGGSTNLSRIK